MHTSLHCTLRTSDTHLLALQPIASEDSATWLPPARSRSAFCRVGSCAPPAFILHGGTGDHGALLYDVWACTVSFQEMTISWKLLSNPHANFKVARAGHLLKLVSPGLLMITPPFQQLTCNDDRMAWGMHYHVNNTGGLSPQYHCL